MEKRLAGQIVTEYLEKFPTLNSHTLSRLIYKDNPEVWSDAGTVRGLIRYHRGASGDKNRKHLADERFVREPGTYNYFNIPQSDEEEYKPFTLPKVNNNILLMADLHIPYHSVDAINAAFSYGKRKEVNTIILNGDIMDCYQLSDFEKDPRKRNFIEELDVTKEFLDTLQEEFPNCVIYYKEANHERRVQRYLKIKAPELYGIPEFNLDVLLGLGARGIHWLKDKQYLKAGKLSILHGDEIGRGVFSPVNFARTLFTKTKTNAIANHSHTTSEHSENALDGDPIVCWSSGALCGLHPQWNPINKWNHGAAHIRTNPDGTFKVFNFRIFNGKVL